MSKKNPTVPEKNQSTPAPKPRIRPELVISIFSLCLSLIAAATNLFQARLQREQQQTAVWPYLEANTIISGKGFSFSVANKGVGPAIITKEQYQYRGKKFDNMVDLVKEVATGISIDYSMFLSQPVKNRVLSPQENLLVYQIGDPEIAELATSKAAEVEIYIEYKSIYGKRWVCRGRTVEALDE